MYTQLLFKALASVIGFATTLLPMVSTVLPQQEPTTKGMAVSYPWVFENGNETSRSLAVTTVEGIASKAGFAPVPTDVAAAAWKSNSIPVPTYGHLPSLAALQIYAKAVHARQVLYGSVSWHTRSIWVNAGPKTISTATVNAYVYDLKTNSVSFRRRGIVGRSDEKSNGYKVAAAVLLTPIVTAVSGGPATPREQYAVQIALGNAYSSWVNHNAAAQLR